MINFDGASLDWYRYQEERELFMNWSNLKQRLLVRFRLVRHGSVCGIFLAIKQETIVEEYRNLFDKIGNIVTTISKGSVRGYFYKWVISKKDLLK